MFGAPTSQYLQLQRVFSPSFSMGFTGVINCRRHGGFATEGRAISLIERSVQLDAVDEPSCGL